MQEDLRLSKRVSKTPKLEDWSYSTRGQYTSEYPSELHPFRVLKAKIIFCKLEQQ